MTFYFSADGTLKHSNRVISISSSGVSTNATTTTSGSSSTSSFTNEMKTAAQNAALKAAGKLTGDDKTAALANSPDYQLIAKYQKRIAEIAARQPRTFNDDEDISFNTTALDSYFTALENKSKRKSSST